MCPDGCAQGGGLTGLRERRRQEVTILPLARDQAVAPGTATAVDRERHEAPAGAAGPGRRRHVANPWCGGQSKETYEALAAPLRRDRAGGSKVSRGRPGSM